MYFIVPSPLQSGLDDLVAPNGKQLERGDCIALYLAKQVLSTFAVDEAIPRCYCNLAGQSIRLVSCKCTRTGKCVVIEMTRC